MNEILREEWRKSLETTPVDALLRMLTPHRAHDVLEEIVEAILEECNPQYADPDFYRSFDFADYEYEER